MLLTGLVSYFSRINTEGGKMKRGGSLEALQGSLLWVMRIQSGFKNELA